MAHIDDDPGEGFSDLLARFLMQSAAVFAGAFLAGLVLWHQFLSPGLERVRDRIPQSYEIRSR